MGGAQALPRAPSVLATPLAKLVEKVEDSAAPVPASHVAAILPAVPEAQAPQQVEVQHAVATAQRRGRATRPA